MLRASMFSPRGEVSSGTPAARASPGVHDAARTHLHELKANLAGIARGLRAGAFCLLTGLSPVHAQDAGSLKARHVALGESLAHNGFQRPLHLESSQTSGELQGDIYAQIEQPYATASAALQGLDQWCEILILHLNVKHCAVLPGAADTLGLNIGRKYDQPLQDTYRLVFAYEVAVVTHDYLRVELNAGEGPFGTRDYRVVLEVVALDAQRSFVHLSYACSYGLMARLALQSYLMTVGSDKVGFSVVGARAGGEPIYQGGMRGVMERNTMRYYLAIEAYLGALSVPASLRSDKRMNDWFTGIERYPLQLHDLEREEYLEMKRREIRRQPSVKSAPSGRWSAPAD